MSASSISAEQLTATLHAQAHALMVARPALKLEAALAQVAALAVMVYDAMTLEAALQKAAVEHNVPDTLAALLRPGGASSALS